MKLQELNNIEVLFKGIYVDGENVYLKLGQDVFLFYEDPSDGYRSYMIDGGVVKAPKKAKFSFEKQPVVLYSRYTDENSGGDFHGIELYLSEKSDTCVVRIGTDHMDDYYPFATHYVDVVKINEEFFNKKSID